MRERIRGYSIRVWIVGLVILFILPLNILLVVSTNNYLEALDRQVEYSTRSILNLYLNQFQREVGTTEAFFFDMSSSDKDFIYILSEKADDRYTLARHSVYRKFENKVSTNYMSTAYYFYTEKDRVSPMLAVKSQTLQNKAGVLKQYLFEQGGIEASSHWRLVTVEGEQYMLRTYQSGTEYYGALIWMGDFLQEIRENLEYPYLDIQIHGKKEMEEEDTKLKVVEVEAEKQDFCIRVFMEERVVYHMMPLVKRVVYFSAFASFLVIPLLFLLLNRIALQPMQCMDQAFSELEGGNSGYRMQEKFLAKELSHMKHSFNRMADQIAHLKIESYEKELEKQKVQLRNIQLQVNPHFLQNMFHLIFSMAQIRNYGGVQKMALYLSRYFRSVINYSEINSIGEELRLVEEYFGILELQYPDCFEVKYEIQESCLDVIVPTLLIHGLVENVAKYAVRMGSYVNVVIRCKEEENGILMEVEDDGPGISREILSAIQEERPVTKTDGMHIGIDNSRKRLRLFFSEQARLQITSEEYMGTKASVFIPKGKVTHEDTIGR